MDRQKHNGGNADEHLAEQPDPLDEPRESQNELVATAATVAVVGAGVLIFEAALLPGLVLGIATMLVPKYLPAIGAAVNPLVRQTVPYRWAKRFPGSSGLRSAQRPAAW